MPRENRRELSSSSHHAEESASSVPLLGTSSAGRNRSVGHCLFQAVAHGGEKGGAFGLAKFKIPDDTGVIRFGMAGKSHDSVVSQKDRYL